MAESLADGVGMRLARSYRAALDLLGTCADARSTAELAALLPPTLHLLGCDEASLGVVSLDRYRVLRTAAFPTQMTEVPDAARLWLTRPAEHPWLEHLVATRDPRSLRLSDIRSRAQLAGSAYWEGFYRPRHLAYSGYATLSTSHGRVVGVALNRQLRDFTLGELDLLEQLQVRSAGSGSASRPQSWTPVAPSATRQDGRSPGPRS